MGNKQSAKAGGVLNMRTKFLKVIHEFTKYNCIFGDDELIHAVLAECDIAVEELPDLAGFLAAEYERTRSDKVEQLQYGVNFIFEARREGYRVNYPTKYILSTESI